MQVLGPSPLSRLLLVCAIAATMLALFFGVTLRAWSLMGFFIAVATASGGISLLFWPTRRDAASERWTEAPAHRAER